MCFAVKKNHRSKIKKMVFRELGEWVLNVTLVLF